MYLSTFRTVLKRLEAKLVSWFAYRPAGDETATSRRIVQPRFEGARPIAPSCQIPLDLLNERKSTCIGCGPTAAL